MPAAEAIRQRSWICRFSGVKTTPVLGEILSRGMAGFNDGKGGAVQSTCHGSGRFGDAMVWRRRHGRAGTGSSGDSGEVQKTAARGQHGGDDRNRCKGSGWARLRSKGETRVSEQRAGCDAGDGCGSMRRGRRRGLQRLQGEALSLGSVNLETVNCGLCEFLVLAGRLCFCELFNCLENEK